MKKTNLLLKSALTGLFILSSSFIIFQKPVAAYEYSPYDYDEIETETSSNEITVYSIKELLDDLVPRIVLHNDVLPAYRLGNEAIYDDLCDINMFTEIENHVTEYQNIDRDYTSRHIDSIDITIRTTSYKTVYFDISYNTTIEQEEYVTSEIKRILSNLNIENDSAYEKVCKIYKYVMDHVEYAYLDDNKTADTSYCTVYQALKYHKGICQSYTLLLNRMLIESGVDAKFVVGTGNGGSHAWSIIKIGSKWYNADVTWDDCSNNKTTYFLKSNSDFKNHIRSSLYNTNSFNSEYPMSLTSYKTNTKLANTPGTTKNTNTSFTDNTSSSSYLSVPNTLQLTVSNTYQINNNIANVTYTSNNNKICKVNKKGQITALKKGTATITIKIKKITIAKVKVIVK